LKKQIALVHLTEVEAEAEVVDMEAEVEADMEAEVVDMEAEVETDMEVEADVEVYMEMDM
jgi:hypothetical protein